MKIIKSKDFKPAKAWAALDIANMNGITTRLHWTDKPYKWHINDGEEVFAVLGGRVEMFYKLEGMKTSVILETGDIFFASTKQNTSPTPLAKHGYWWSRQREAFNNKRRIPVVAVRV